MTVPFAIVLVIGGEFGMLPAVCTTIALILTRTVSRPGPRTA
ncbi:hypothetical protein [Actinokineospora sp.]